MESGDTPWSRFDGAQEAEEEEVIKPQSAGWNQVSQGQCLSSSACTATLSPFPCPWRTSRTVPRTLRSLLGDAESYSHFKSPSKLTNAQLESPGKTCLGE